MWSRNYRTNFVPASGSSSQPTHRYPSTSGNMNNVPPPPSLTMPNAAGAASMGLNAREIAKQKEEEYAALVYGEEPSSSKKEREPRKKKIYDDEYLEKDEDSDEESPQKQSKVDTKKTEEEKEEVDELDAFMAGVEAQAAKDKDESAQKELDRKSGKLKEEKDDKKKLGRADIDEEDMQESYFKFLEEKKAREEEEEEIYAYDEDGNIIWTWKKVIDPLPAIDHSTISYPSFHANFYKEHPDIQRLSAADVSALREKLGIKVGGRDVPKPVASFAHFGFDEEIMDVIRKSEYEHPTPIQAQAIPAALAGRDVLGIAKTGSGKTVAYLWPAIVHIMDQSDLKEGDGPIALIVVPTRELAIQVYQEAKRFCKAYNINVICAYGGGSKWEQQNELRDEGAELVGRIIDLVKLGATNFLRTTFLVFDEADRSFDMGFEEQVRSISDHIRPDRQCLMFSATFKSKVERLAREALRDPVRIVQGEVGEANADIVQTVVVLHNLDRKWAWLLENLVYFASVGKVLIFVTKKQNAEDVATKLKLHDYHLVLLHGDMQQQERNEMLSSFRKDIPIMVATDVAARGLDISEIRTVINFDLARDIDTHVHRIGRTGRAGQRGDAYTLVTEGDKEMAGHLVRNLESVNQVVPDALLEIAMKSEWFRKSRGGQAGTSSGPARMGLGYKPKTRPAKGSTSQIDPLKETGPHRPSIQETVQKVAQQAGPMGGGRLAMMKNAFKAQFQSTFKASSTDEFAARNAQASDPRPEWKRRLDDINAAFAQGQMPSEGARDSSEPGAKKKSRWQ